LASIVTLVALLSVSLVTAGPARAAVRTADWQPAATPITAPRAAGGAAVLPAMLDSDWTVRRTGYVSDAPSADDKGAGESVRWRLQDVMEHYRSFTFVPYVWGGDKIGSPSECMACRSCIEDHKHLRVERRLKACSACQSCGIDCSHFVNRVYKDAGLAYQYLTTRDLRRTPARKLREKFGLVDIGRDVRKALPGDILLHPKHVVLVLEVREPGRGDILHVSRSIESDGRVGGVEVAENQDLRGFRGRILKILRHV
jgi:cell wall-associated NlpC family hydrolase